MKYDVAIIGGGPAGMMSAIHAGELGSRVILIEKNKNLGVKLMVTGKGRCNITNKTDRTKEMIKQYGENGKFLFTALNNFGVDDVIDFFENSGVKIKVERGARAFPESDMAKDILNTLIHHMKASQVQIKTGTAVEQVVKKGKKIEKLILVNKEEVIADNYIICTGGKSYPNTGSTGDGYVWAKKLGHTIIKPIPALTPIITKDKIVKELEGLSLKNVEISVFKNNKKVDSRMGEALFTYDGMSGPIILDMSKKIGQLLPGVFIKIDFKPALEFNKLDERIQRDFKEGSNKMFKNMLDALLPQKLIPVFIKLLKINPEKKVNEITKEERKKLVHLLKGFELEVQDLVGFSKAIVTSGGVKLTEVDPKTMKSKIIDNLYFAGEVLDIDGVTGGYNLQSCWSTGYLAGESSSS